MRCQDCLIRRWSRWLDEETIALLLFVWLPRLGAVDQSYSQAYPEYRDVHARPFLRIVLRGAGIGTIGCRVRRYQVADLFCGAGGSSSGAARAIARLDAEIDLVAINHWDVAIATHSLNHPKAQHACVNLDSARPEELVPGGRLDLLMASPECVHFSRARAARFEHGET